MNNSLQRVFDGIVTALRVDVIPVLDDEYSAGQALAIVDLLGHLASRVDWAVEPLLDKARAQRELLEKLETLFAGQPGFPIPGKRALLPDSGEALQRLCDHHDAEIGAIIRWSATAPGQRTAANDWLLSYVRQDLQRELGRTPKPLFAEISRGRDASRSSISAN